VRVVTRRGTVGAGRCGQSCERAKSGARLGRSSGHPFVVRSLTVGDLGCGRICLARASCITGSECIGIEDGRKRERGREGEEREEE
jgi:hypothetical protein